MIEENTNLIDELIEKAVEYGKSSLELAKLKAIDKTSDSISSVFAHSVVVVILVAFMLFLSLGLASSKLCNNYHVKAPELYTFNIHS